MGTLIDKFDINDCPYCYGTEGLNIDRCGKYAQVACDDCGAKGPDYITVQQAVDAWNSPTDDMDNLEKECARLRRELDDCNGVIR